MRLQAFALAKELSLGDKSRIGLRKKKKQGYDAGYTLVKELEEEPKYKNFQ